MASVLIVNTTVTTSNGHAVTINVNWNSGGANNGEGHFSTEVTDRTGNRIEPHFVWPGLAKCINKHAHYVRQYSKI